MVNASTTTTYYNDVRVGDDAIIGEVNRGWDLIVNQLNYERVSLCPTGSVERCYEDTVRWAKETKLADGRRVVDQEWAQINLARVRAKIEFIRLLNWKVASGKINPADASSAKVFGTEFFTEAYRLLLEVVGPAGALRRGSPAAVVSGRIERAMQGTLILTFGGGVNEVQRDLIALFGLGLPRVPRH
jgi:alkylation response protein AidB-like acyl-CoA dehydrogenase